VKGIVNDTNFFALHCSQISSISSNMCVALYRCITFIVCHAEISTLFMKGQNKLFVCLSRDKYVQYCNSTFFTVASLSVKTQATMTASFQYSYRLTTETLVVSTETLYSNYPQM